MKEKKTSVFFTKKFYKKKSPSRFRSSLSLSRFASLFLSTNLP